MIHVEKKKGVGWKKEMMLYASVLKVQVIHWFIGRWSSARSGKFPSIELHRRFCDYLKFSNGDFYPFSRIPPGRIWKLWADRSGMCEGGGNNQISMTLMFYVYSSN